MAILKFWRFPRFVCYALLWAATLVIILLMSIGSAVHQYELVELKSEIQQLQQYNEALSEELWTYETPASLAQRAESLNMKPVSPAYQLDLKTGEISGPSSSLPAR